MTGFDIYNKCMALLGYTYQEGEIITGKTLKARFPEILNQILNDLKMDSTDDLSAEILLDSKQKDALVNGCAMLLSFSEGDVEKNRIFTAIYNAKRAAALANTGSVKDVLPTV